MSAKSDLLDAIKRVKSRVQNQELNTALTKTMPGAMSSMATGFPSLPTAGLSEPQVIPQQPVQQKPRSIIQETAGTIGRIPYQAGSQILDMAGLITGIPAFPEASKKVMENSRSAFPSNTPEISSMADLSSASVSDLAWYALANSGQVVSSGLAVAIPGSALNRVLLPAIGKLATVSPAISKMVGFMGGAEKAAQAAASFGGSTLLEAGSIAQDVHDKSGELPGRLKTLAWAIPAGALEGIGNINLLRMFSRKVPAGIAEEAAKRTGRDLVNFVVDYAKDMGVEGGTEFAQTLIEEAAALNLTGTPAGKAITQTVSDPNSLARGFAAGITGATGAGGMKAFSDAGKKVFAAEPSTTPAKQPAMTPAAEVKRILGETPVPEQQQETLSEVVTMDTTPEFDQSNIEQVKKAVAGNQADVGGNITPADAQVLKMRKQIKPVLEGIGIVENDVDNFAGELFYGKKFEDLGLLELQQLYQAAISMAAQGNVVAPAQPTQMQPAPVTQPPAPVPVMPMATRPENMQQALQMAQQKTAMRPTPQPQMQPVSRQPMQQTQAVTNQITPEDMLPFADQPEQAQPDDAIPTEKWAIYRRTLQSKNGPVQKFAIRQNMEKEQGFGDTLYDTQAEAEAARDQKRELERANKEYYDKQQAKEAEASRIKKEADDRRAATAKENRDKSKVYVDDAYVESLGKLAKGRLQKVLSTEISYGGKTMTQRELVESGNYVSKNARTKNGKETYYLVTANERYLSVPKIVYDAVKLREEIEQPTDQDATREDLDKLFGKEQQPEPEAISPEPAAPVTQENPDVSPWLDKDETQDQFETRMKYAERMAPFDTKQKIQEKINQLEAFNQPTGSMLGTIDYLKRKLAALDDQRIIPKDGWRTHLIKARDYANRLGIDTKGSSDTDTIVAQIDEFLGAKPSIEDAIMETLTGQKPTPLTYGSQNTLVSTSEYEDLIKQFKSKTKNITSGIDPELAVLTTKIAVYHLEAGVRKFADFAAAVIRDAGESFRPYLASAYMSAKYYPGAEKFRAEMDSETEINKQMEPAAAKKKPSTVTAYEDGSYVVKIAQMPDGTIQSIRKYASDKEAKIRYLTARGSFVPDSNDAHVFSADVIDEAVKTAIAVEFADNSGNGPEYYRKNVKPLQDKLIQLANPAETRTADIADKLVPFAKSLLTREKPATNVDLDKAMVEAGLDPNDRKKAQESLEGAITLLIRQENLYGDFFRLNKLYTNMPNLNERTGGSMTRQAYSTPHILTSILTEAIGLPKTGGLTIYEPTAGNGLLLSGVVENSDATKNTYFLNELDKSRNEMLEKLFPEAVISNEDATTFEPYINVDLVMANPPFGSIPAETVYPTKGEKSEIVLTKLEYFIAWKALENMRDDGKAVIILGAEKENQITGNHSIFVKAMYNQFNITGHFELDGQFYRKMGAEWPVEIFVIEGRKDYPLNRNLLKTPKSVRRIAYAEGWTGIKDYVETNVKQGKYINRADQPDSGRKDAGDTRQPEADNRIPNDKRSEKVPEGQTGPGIDTQSIPAETAGQQKKQQLPDSKRNNEPGRDTERIKRVKRNLTDGSEKRPDKQRDTTTPDAVKPGPDDTRIDSDEIGIADSLQANYESVSEAASINSLIPKNLAEPTRRSLLAILKATGENTLEDYVAKQLGYKSGKDISFFAGEQIDALAETFWSFNRNGGNIIADQTGLGKGRIAAGAIQWAVKNGKIPVFVTEKVGLFNDIYRDLKDIGQSGLRPFMFNSNGEMSYTNDNDEKVVAYKHNKKIYDEVFKRMVAGDFSDFTGPNRKFDYIAMTYSQVRDSDEKRTAANGGVLKIDAFLNARNLVAVLDESHNAAGAAGDTNTETAGAEGGGRFSKKTSNQMDRMMQIIDPQRSDAVIYLSATWAKTPENIPIYHRAFDQANLTQDEISTAFRRGSVAMQEMVVSAMAANGKYLRREQSYAGVSWQRNETEEGSERAAEEKSLADRAMKEVRGLVALDQTVSAAMAGLNIIEVIDTYNLPVPEEYLGGEASAGASVSSSLDRPDSPFSGVHNYINAFLAAVKADRAADRAIEMIKAGQKPIITVQNTMGSHLDTLIQMGEGEIGKPFAGTFAEIIESNISKLFAITIKHPTNPDKSVTIRIPLEALPVDIQEKVAAFRKNLKKADLYGLPFSPIDYVMAKIQAAGYTVGEITGRDKYLDYSDTVGGYPVIRARSGKETSNSGKRRTLDRFNSGELDAMLLNSSGATGLSAHSSAKFKDQRQRTMVILQPFDDINTFTQMLGRIHRTGGVYKESMVTSRIEGKPAKYGFPMYEYMQSSLGMEERPAARLDAKAKSLNANTSSNKQGRQKVSDIDVHDKYGSKVIARWLRDNRNYAFELGYAEIEDIERSFASQVTGRIAILDQQVQNSFWDEVTKNYTDLIDELNSLDMNDLVVPTYEKADAVTIKKTIVYGAEGDANAPPVYSEIIEMAEVGNPTSYDAAVNRAKTGSSPTQEQIEKNDAAFKRFIAFKKQEAREFEERTGRPSGINFDRVETTAAENKKLLERFKPGTIVNGKMLIETEGGDTEIDIVGIITDVKIAPASDDFIGNPWLPSRIKVTIATPSFASGKIIQPMSKIAHFQSKNIDKMEAYILERVKDRWNKDYEKNSSKRVRKMALSGDVIKASTMSDSSAARAVQIQRRGGQQDLVWLATGDDGIMEIQAPVEKLTDEQINNPPAIISSMDADQDIQIADWRQPPKENYWTPDISKKKYEPVQTGAENYDIRVRYQSSYRKMIISDKKLAEILDPKNKDPFVKETLQRNANYMVLKENLYVPKSKLPAALKRIAEILESKGGGLTDSSLTGRQIDTEVSAPEMIVNPRRGSPGWINIIGNYIADKSLPVLESAYNFLVRGGGSFLDWLKTVAAKFRSAAAKAWKDAQKIISLSGRSGLGRRGAVMSFKELVKSAQESIALATEEGKKPLPAPAIEDLVVETATTAFDMGVAKEHATAAKKIVSQRKRTEARIVKIKGKLASMRKLTKLSYEARRYLVELASKLPSKEKADLIRAIASANTPLQVGEVIRRIDALYTKVVRRQAMKRFSEAVRSARQLRPEFQTIADDIRRGDKKSWIAYEALDGIMKYLNDNDAVFIPGEAMAAIESLRNNRPKVLSVETIDLISQTLETLAHMSKIENEKIFAENTRTLSQAVKDILKHIVGEDRWADYEGKFGESVRWFFNLGSMQYEAVTEMLGDVGRKLFYSDMREGERKAKELWFQGRDLLHAAMESVGLKPEDAATTAWLEEKVTVAGIEMTRDEMMNLSANLKDPSTLEEIERAGFKLKSDKNKVHQLTRVEISDIVNRLSEKEAMLVDTMRKFVNGKLKNEINDTWVSLAGYEKALKKDYWPRTRDIVRTGVNQGYKQFAKTALEELGIFKERQTSKEAVIIGNATDTYQNHLKKSSTFAGLAIPIRNIEMAMGKGGLGQALENQFGKNFVTRIEEQVQAVADLGHSGEGMINRALSGVLRRISVGFLGFNLRSALKQFGGLFTAATEISGAYLMSSIDKAFDGETRREMYKHSAILRDRYDSTGAKLAGPSFDSTQPIVGNKEVWTRRAMKLLENFDRAVSQIIWEASKKEIKAANPEISYADLMEQTAKRAELIVSRTQNVTSILDMSGVGIEARKNSMLKAVTMFQSQGNSIYNIIRRAIRGFRNGKVTSGQLIGTLTLATMGNAIWSSMIGNLVSGQVLGSLIRGGGDDDKEKKELKDYVNLSETAWDILQENMNMFYGGSLASSFTRNIKRIADKDPVFISSGRLENATESVINNAMQGTTHLLTAILGEDKKLKSGINKGSMRSSVELEKAAMKLVVRGIMPLAGLPTFPVSEGYKLLYSK